mgnify:CR=1 FL=1
MTETEPFFLLLKSHRESNDIDIQDISEHTKINPKYLNAIESGDFSLLPTVYMRLFLRSYAEFIGTDAQKALDDYEIHTTGKLSNKTKNKTEVDPDDLNKNLDYNIPILSNSPIPPKQILTGVAVFLGIFLFFNLISSLSQKEIDIKQSIDNKSNTNSQSFNGDKNNSNTSINSENLEKNEIKPIQPDLPLNELKKKP